MDICLYQAGNTLTLNGGEVSGVIRAARFADDDLRTMEVMLEGAPAGIAATLSALNGWLFEARRTAGAADAHWVYLRVTLPDGSAWRTPLTGGQAYAARGPAGRGTRSQGLRVELARGDFWEHDALTPIPLSNRHGSGVSALLYNHADNGHDNHCDLAPLEGDLPTPLALETSMPAAPNTETFLGLASYADLSRLRMAFEVEEAQPGEGVAHATGSDAACSNAAYDTRSWSGADPVILAYWTPSTAVVSAFAGRFYRPMLRLQSLPAAGERFWAQLKLAYESGGTLEVIHETEPALLAGDRLLAPLPPVQLPPWPTLDADSYPAALLLSVRAEDGGSHQLKLDYLALIPMDSYLQLSPKVTSYPDFNILFDSEKRLLKNNDKSIGTHLPEGDGLWATPGRENRLAALWRRGSASDIGNQMAVNLSYRPRRRSL